VETSQTYPEILKKELTMAGHEVSIDHASFRKITDLPELIKKYPNGDLYIIQAGIVDLYPRPMSQERTLSQSFSAKLARRIIRLNRGFFIRYVRNKPWSSQEELKKAISELLSSGRRTIWLNAAPVNTFQNRQTPGANDSINSFNDLLKEEVKKHSHTTLLDIHGMLLATGEYEKYLHPKDSHLNKKGNEFYAAALRESIDKIVRFTK
jgi:hypothetical protein